MASAAQQYLHTQVRSSTPLELVVLLYDRAIRRLDEACAATARGDLRTRRAALSNAMAIISELQSTLDVDRGGDIARNLDGLYGWMTTRLADAIVQRRVEPLVEVRRTLEPLADAWRQLARNAGAQP